LAVAVAYVMRNAVEEIVLISWLASVLVLNITRLALFSFKPVSSLTSVERTHWAWKYTVSVGILGIAWGVAGILFFAGDAPHLNVFLAFVLGGLSAGAVTTYVSWLPAFFSFSLLSISPLAVRFFLEPGELPLIMGAMLALFLIFTSVLAKSFNNSMIQMLSLKVERSHLLNERDVSEAFFSKAFHSSPALMAVSRPSGGRLYDVNNTWTDITGYTYDEAMQSSVTKLGIWDRPAERDRFLQEIDKHGHLRGWETVFRTKNGDKLDMLVSGEMIDVGDEKRLLFIGQDITRLKEVERLKSEFVSIVSHELRTPLTSIKGSLGLILGGATGNISEKSTELLELAQKNAAKLELLVNDILDFERLQSGRMQFEFKDCDLAQLIKETVRQCAPYAENLGVTLQVEPLPENLIVNVDSDRIGQVLINILSNAVKFSPKDEHVKIAAMVKDAHVRVEIADNGPGINDDFKDQVFDRFAQEDSSDTRSIEGSGLGLSISKSIIDQHEGEIGFDSWVGIGSTFYFELPLA